MVTKDHGSNFSVNTVQHLEQDSDDENWVPFKECPYPELKADKLRLDTMIQIQ